jgi:hypothetical protein
VGQSTNLNELAFHSCAVVTPIVLERVIRLGIDGIIDIFRAYFAVISGVFRIRGLRKHHEVRRHSLDDIIDP